MDFYDAVDFDELLDELSYFDQPSYLLEQNEVITSSSTSTSEDDSDSYSTNASLSPVVFEQKEKKMSRKKRLQLYCYIPKILKSDIRHSYPAMLANVLNTGDFSLMFGFMDTFFAPNVVQVSRKKVTNSAAGAYEISQSGKYDLAKYWYANLIVAPDTVAKFSDSQIVSYKGTPDCKIVTKLCLDMSYLYEEQTNPKECSSILMSDDSRPKYVPSGSVSSCGYMSVETDSESVSDDSTKGSGRKRNINEMNESAQKQAIMSNIVSSVESIVSRLTLRAEPVRISSVGTIAMYTNEHKMITKMELVADMAVKAQ